MMPYCTTLLILTLATTRAWVFLPNVDHITPHKTENVQLVCKQDGKNGSGQTITTINDIRIIKIDPFGTANTFAEINRIDRQPSSRGKGVEVTASMNQETGVFLKVTWPKANDETEGAYGCEVGGYDDSDNYVTIHVTPSVKISRRMLTEDDVIGLIHKLTQNFKKKQEELELEIGKLRGYIDENMKSTRRHIRDNDDKVNAKLSKLENTMESTYSTKDELKEHRSALKNFTINKIRTDNSQSKKELDKLSSLARNRGLKCEERYTETAQNLSSLQVQFTTSVVSLNRKQRNISSRLDSAIQNLTIQVNSVATKCEREMRILDTKFNRKFSNLQRKCDFTTPAPTTPTPTSTPIPKLTPPIPKATTSDWPGGNYALVRPDTGCANSKSLEAVGRSLFKTLPYSATGFYNVKNSVDIAGVFKLILKSRSKKSELKYCVPNTSTPSQTSQSWPKGTYCIASIGGSCPIGFGYGYVNYKIAVYNTLVGEYKMEHCCRSDHIAQVQIKLPKDAPFYLFRFKDRCQSVEGMLASSHKILVETSDTHGLGENIHGISYKYPHGDVPKLSPQLCYYQPWP